MNARPPEKKTNGHARWKSSIKASFRDFFQWDSLHEGEFPMGPKMPNVTTLLFFITMGLGSLWLILRLFESFKELLK